MARISLARVRKLLLQGASATTAKGKGDALEEAISYVFGRVPGLTVTSRNVKNTAGTEEIDLAIWNERHVRGFRFLPEILLVECKNWSVPVGSLHVNWFDSKLRSRGLSHGFLFAANGITGDTADRTEAHSIIAKSLEHGRRVIVVTGDDLGSLKDTEAFVALTKQRMCDLVVGGSFS